MEDGKSLGKIPMVETEAEQKMAAWGSMGEKPAKGLTCKEGGPVLGSDPRGMGSEQKKMPKGV
jgi:hypothetical protein